MPDRNKSKLMQDSSDIEMEQTVSKLARYYRLDRKRKVFDIPMHFKKASDLFCGNVDFMDEPKISDKTTDMMVELLNDIPRGYKADLCITIDDYEGFSSRQILRGLNDALAFRHIRFVRENKRNGLHVGTLMVAGISLILFMTLGNLNGFWDSEGVVPEVFIYLLDTFGCVLIWEAVYAIFVERSAEIDFEHTITGKVSSVGLYETGSETVLAVESSERLESLMIRNRKKIISDKLLLLSGFSLITLAVFGILKVFRDIQLARELGMFKVFLVAFFRSFSAIIIAGVGTMAIRVYLGRFRHKVLGAVSTVLMLVALVLTIWSMFMGPEVSETDVIMILFHIAAEAAFVVGISLRMSYSAQLNRLKRNKDQEVSV